MSGTRPTLDDYFARARKDRATAADPTLALLAEYRAKAERRRRRRIVAVTAFSCVLLGAVAFEFTSPFSSVQHAPLADVRPAPGPAATEQPIATPPETEGPAHAVQPPASPSAPEDNSSAAGRKVYSATRHSIASHETESAEEKLHTPAEPQSDRPDAVAIAEAAMMQVPAAVQRSSDRHFIFPPEEPDSPLFPFSEPVEEQPRTLALTVGGHYGAAATDISPINEQLAELNFPSLRSQYEQTTVQAGIAVGNMTVGVAYTSPYTESVTGTHPLPSALANTREKLTVTTTFAHKRWSTFGEYSFALTDELRLDAGAQISFTSYELGLESNYMPPLTLDPSTDTGSEEKDVWEGMWNRVEVPSDFTNFGEKLAAGRPLGGMTSRSIGISPTIGVSWRALPALNFQCRVSYMFNANHEWRTTSTGAPVKSVNDKLRMNEYSISIGASFYQWLF